MSSTPMVHVLELFLVSVFFFVARSAIDEPRFSQILWLILILAAAILTRVFSIIPLIAPVLCFFVLVKWNKRKRLHVISVFLGLLLGAGLLAAYQLHTTGNATLSAYTLEYPDIFFGFGRTFLGEIHTPARGLENISNLLNGLNVWVTGSPAGIMPFLLLFLFSEPKFTRWDHLFTAGCFLLLALYFFFVAPDLVIGPRYMYVVTPIILLFVARSTGLDNDRQRSQYPAGALLLVSFVFYILFGFANFVQRYNPKFTQAGYLKRSVGELQSNSIVFLGSRIHQHFVSWNDPFLSKPTILCRDRGDQNRQLLSRFPRHQPLYFELAVGNTVKGEQSGYRIRNGSVHSPPLSFFELAALIITSSDGDEDFIDSFYAEYVESDLKAALDFANQESVKPETATTIQAHYRKGLIHTAQLILEPRVWSLQQQSFALPDSIIERFRIHYDHAVEQWWSSGELGSVMMVAFQKINARIDQNQDRAFSDQEIRSFLRKKLRVPS
jgi:hypothetical protein